MRPSGHSAAHLRRTVRGLTTIDTSASQSRVQIDDSNSQNQALVMIAAPPIAAANERAAVVIRRLREMVDW